MHERVGDRVAEQEGEGGGAGADAERVEEDPGIERLDQLGEIVEGEPAGIERSGRSSRVSISQLA